MTLFECNQRLLSVLYDRVVMAGSSCPEGRKLTWGKYSIISYGQRGIHCMSIEEPKDCVRLLVNFSSHNILFGNADVQRILDELYPVMLQLELEPILSSDKLVNVTSLRDSCRIPVITPASDFVGVYSAKDDCRTCTVHIKVTDNVFVISADTVYYVFAEDGAIYDVSSYASQLKNLDVFGNPLYTSVARYIKEKKISDVYVLAQSLSSLIHSDVDMEDKLIKILERERTD